MDSQIKKALKIIDIHHGMMLEDFSCFFQLPNKLKKAVKMLSYLMKNGLIGIERINREGIFLTSKGYERLENDKIDDSFEEELISQS